MIKNIYVAVAMLVFTSVVATLAAQQTQAEEKHEGTILHLDVVERTQVTQNRLRAQLSFQAEDMDARTVQNKINKAMADGLKTVKKQKDIAVETGHYQVYPRYDYKVQDGSRERIISHWQGSQSLILKSETPESVLTAVRDLQNMDFTISSLEYQVTPELREATRNSLMEKAVQKLRTQAERVAKALGKDSVKFSEIQVGKPRFNSGPIRPMKALAEGMSRDMEAPVADAGETDITLTLSAKVILE